MANRIRKTFSVTDGYSVADFLHYGFDNVAAAELLFKANARYFDSAGYLAHLGLELLLKAWHLHTFGHFEEGHHLSGLWSKLRQHDSKLCIDNAKTETLEKIDQYFTLRYPNPAMPQEIDSDDLLAILSLQSAICSQMPPKMQSIINSLTGDKKGGRVLMEKRIDGLP